MKTRSLILILTILILGLGCGKEDYLSDSPGKKPVYISYEDLAKIDNLDPQPTENSGLTDTVGNLVFMVEKNKGIHVIDIRNHTIPVKLTFIKIPAVNDFTISDNTLSADNGINLVSLDISHVSHVVILNIDKNAFNPILAPPLQYQGFFECVDTDKGFVIGWEDTLFKKMPDVINDIEYKGLFKTASNLKNMDMPTRYILFSLATLFCITALQAQPENAEVKGTNITLSRDNFLPKATIKINLPALFIDPKQAFYLATDIKIKKLLSIDVGAGTYFNSWAYSQYNGESFNGLRARIGFKYFYTFKKNWAPYLGMEVLFNHAFSKQYYDVTKHGTVYNEYDGSRFDGYYNEKMLITTETTAKGVSIRTGATIFMGSKKQFFLDFYCGLGIKLTDKDRHSPVDASQVSRNKRFWLLDDLGFDYDREPGHYVNPYVSLGVYFGYCIR